MNELYLIVTSNLNNLDDVLRLFKSIDISEKIHLFFINQNCDIQIKDFYSFQKINITEINVGKIIPLSCARNLALSKIYSKKDNHEKTLVLFPDDDAWFPIETLNFLLECKNNAYSLKTIDPILNKSFNNVKNNAKIVKGWHVVKDICSICIVLPLKELLSKKLYFNEKLGLGNIISQGEESLFIYILYDNGMSIINDNHYVYHPYKQSSNLNNYYSMSYFWTCGLFNISSIFFYPCVKYLVKYSIALLLFFENSKYIEIFKLVWKGAFDGFCDKYQVVNKS